MSAILSIRSSSPCVTFFIYFEIESLPKLHTSVCLFTNYHTLYGKLSISIMFLECSAAAQRTNHLILTLFQSNSNAIIVLLDSVRLPHFTLKSKQIAELSP